MAGGGILLGCLVEGVGSGPESLGKNMRALSFSCLCMFFSSSCLPLWILPIHLSVYCLLLLAVDSKSLHSLLA